jgi:hypothetical protein
MKTQTTSAVADKKNDVMLEVQLAACNAPSYEALNRATDKLASLNTVAGDEQEIIDRLAKQQESGADDKAERARALLDGKAVADTAIKETIAAAYRRLGVVKEAIAIQTRVVQVLQAQHGGEVNTAIKKSRQPLVSRMAAALKELRAAAADDAEIVTALAKHGIRGGDSIVFIPVSAYSAQDEQWLRGMRAMNYTV